MAWLHGCRTLCILLCFFILFAVPLDFMFVCICVWACIWIYVYIHKYYHTYIHTYTYFTREVGVPVTLILPCVQKHTHLPWHAYKNSFNDSVFYSSNSRSPVRSPMGALNALTPSTPMPLTLNSTPSSNTSQARPRRSSISNLSLFFRSRDHGSGSRSPQSSESFEGGDAEKSSKVGVGFFRSMSPSRLSIFGGSDSRRTPSGMSPSRVTSPSMSRVGSFESLPDISEQDMRRIGARNSSPVSFLYGGNKLCSKLESNEDSDAVSRDTSPASLTPKLLRLVSKDSLKGEPSPLQLASTPPQLQSLTALSHTLNPAPTPGRAHAIAVYQDQTAKWEVQACMQTTREHIRRVPNFSKVTSRVSMSFV